VPACGARFSISAERCHPQLSDRGLKLKYPLLQRRDRARVQAQLEVFLVDAVVERSDVAGGHDGVFPFPALD
jgi:hypothetical protein